MAEHCGIHIATTKLITLSSGHDVFLSKRFDRTPDGKRIHMASALNLLGLTQEDTHKRYYAYPEIADFIVSNGTDVEKSLQELYRRIAYTICIGNTDDHLKNHSFLLTKKGWELSPVYDINPSVGHTHSLLIDGVSNASSLDNLFKAHKLYKLDKEVAFDIIKDVTQNMKNWKNTARDCGISEKDKAYDDFSQRFTEGMSWSI
jgi:serine/threonine-protein kinase HipA